MVIATIGIRNSIKQAIQFFLIKVVNAYGNVFLLMIRILLDNLHDIVK